MKVPKNIKRYCRNCKKHTEQSTEHIKTGGRRKTSSLKKATRYRNIKLHKGYGGSPYPKMEHGVKYGAKSTKKIMLRFKCKVCGKMNQIKSPTRAKKFEIQK